MGSLVAELAEKLSSATNNFDIDEGTIYVNTSADTVAIGGTSPDGKFSIHQSASADILNLYDGTDVVFSVLDGGNVGIGTTAPTGLLTIRGSADNANLQTLTLTNSDWTANETSQSVSIEFQINRSGTTPAAAGRIVTGKDTHYNTTADVDSFMAFYTAYNDGNFERMRIDSNGNGGIGTTAPDQMLHLESGGAPIIQIESTSGGGGGTTVLFKNVSQQNQIGIIGDGTHSLTDNDFVIRDVTDNAPRFVIDTSGNVLIGGNTSAETMVAGTPRVQVEGLGYGNSSLSLFNNSNDTNGSYLFIGKSRGTALSSDTIIQDGDYVGGIEWVAADGTDRASRIAGIYGVVDGTPGANDTPGELLFLLLLMVQILALKKWSSKQMEMSA